MATGPRESMAAAVRGLLHDCTDGRAKLWVTRQGLALRSAHLMLFRDGDYQALPAEGARARHVVAFARRHEDEACAVVCGRLFASLGLAAGALPTGADAWGDTTLPAPLPWARSYHDALTGRVLPVQGTSIAVADVLADFPVAFLMPQR